MLIPRPSVSGALAFAALLGSPAPAVAATVEPEPGSDGENVIRFTAAGGERNKVTLRASADAVAVRDAGAPIEVIRDLESICTSRSRNEIACPPDTVVLMRLGGGDDTLTVAASRRRLPSLHVNPGGGDDRISGGPEFTSIEGSSGNDILAGGAGSDTLLGGTGSDRLRGDAGDDQLAGGAGRDDLGGGRGQDRVTYEGTRRGSRVTVTLDGRRNDGAAREADWVRADIEDVVVAGGADRTLVGNSGRNWLQSYGAPGLVRGGAGADSLSGGGRMLGEAGNDRIAAGEKGDFFGGPGDDFLYKGSDLERTASARLFGGPGNDTLSGVDCTYPVESCDPQTIPDRLFCGPGRDRATPGSRDVAAADCERRR